MIQCSLSEELLHDQLVGSLVVNENAADDDPGYDIGWCISAENFDTYTRTTSHIQQRIIGVCVCAGCDCAVAVKTIDRVLNGDFPGSFSYSPTLLHHQKEKPENLKQIVGLGVCVWVEVEPEEGEGKSQLFRCNNDDDAAVVEAV